MRSTEQFVGIKVGGFSTTSSYNKYLQFSSASFKKWADYRINLPFKAYITMNIDSIPTILYT